LKPLSTSIKVFGGLILVLALLGGISVFMPQGEFGGQFSGQELPASKPVVALVSGIGMVIVYGGLGLVGLLLSGKIGYAELWDKKVTNKQRLVIPALVGGGLGIFLVLADGVFSKFHSLGQFPHPPFPLSLLASATAGIGEEVMFRLFFISFWVWLVSRILLKNRWPDQVFWVVTVFSALVFAAAHIPAVFMIGGFKSIGEISPAIIVEIFLLNGVVSLFCAVHFKKYGILAAISIHFWCDVVWHVIWGALA